MGLPHRNNEVYRLKNFWWLYELVKAVAERMR